MVYQKDFPISPLRFRTLAQKETFKEYDAQFDLTAIVKHRMIHTVRSHLTASTSNHSGC